MASFSGQIYEAKYRILRMSGEIRRNWFFSNFDRTFLESVRRRLAQVLSIDRWAEDLAKAAEKLKIRLLVLAV